MRLIPFDRFAIIPCSKMCMEKLSDLFFFFFFFSIVRYSAHFSEDSRMQIFHDGIRNANIDNIEKKMSEHSCSIMRIARHEVAFCSSTTARNLTCISQDLSLGLQPTLLSVEISSAIAAIRIIKKKLITSLFEKCKNERSHNFWMYAHFVQTILRHKTNLLKISLTGVYLQMWYLASKFFSFRGGHVDEIKHVYRTSGVTNSRCRERNCHDRPGS